MSTLTPDILRPDRWATETEIDEDDRTVIHSAEVEHGRYTIVINHSFLGYRDFGVDVRLYWDWRDVAGIGERRTVTVDIGEIPELIGALQRALEVVEPPRILRRDPRVDDELRDRDA